MKYKEALEKIARVNAMDYEYQAWAKEALAQPEPWEKFCDSNCVWTDHHPDCKLSQPEQEPVAWYDKDGVITANPIEFSQPLYTTSPQPEKLDQDEVDIRSRLYQRIHELETQLAQPEQEPVGSLSVRYHRGCKSMTNTDFDYNGDLPEGDYELYTTPPQRKPLTCFDTEKLAKQCGVEWTTRIDKLCKLAIEAAHNIKE